MEGNNEKSRNKLQVRGDRMKTEIDITEKEKVKPIKTELVLELSDVYGGDGITRTETIQQTKLKRTKKEKEKRTDIGLQVSDRETEEEKVEEIEKEIHTFRKNDEGGYVMRLGGTHGKIYGALKEIASSYRLQGIKPFTSGYKAILNSITIMPVWVKLEMNDGVDMHVEELPQILAGFKKTMIVQKFDCIPKCQVKMMLTYPSVMKDAVETLIKGLENISMLNKRRATCKIIKT